MDFVAGFPIAPRLREPLAAALRGRASDWPDPLSRDEVNAIVAHGMAPLVYASAALPQLRNEAMRAAAHEPLRASDLAEVLAALAARGVQPLITKGTALAYDIYTAPELRPRSDTDLLIAREDLSALRETMLSRGFEEVPSSGDEHGLRQAVFTRAPGMVYDVHWAATNVPAFDAVLHYDDLRTRAIALPSLGPHARGLSHVDALLMACIHRVAHHHDSDRLIWLVDIALLRDRMTADEHRVFWRQAADGHVVAVCSRSIELADEWMSRAPRHRAEGYLSREEIERDEPTRAVLNHEMTYGRVMVANLRALPWPARLRRLRQLAFPPAEFMRSRFKTRSSLLLPLLYVYRGLRGITRLFKRAAS